MDCGGALDEGEGGGETAIVGVVAVTKVGVRAGVEVVGAACGGG